MTVCLQARKLGEKRTVEALARQFQDQIERILTEKVGGQTAFTASLAEGREELARLSLHDWLGS